MPRSSWLQRRVLFFGGKGGVGKTTCATAFAMLAARRGRRTLLVSTDPAHSTADILETRIGPDVGPLGENLWAVQVDPEREADRYIEQVRKQLFGAVKPHLKVEVERQIEMARVSPGAEEAALFDRIADLVQEARRTYDLLVFDTAPTGHTLRLLTLPELMQAWVEGMLHRRQQVNQMSAMWRQMTVGRGADDVEDPVEAALLARRRKFYQMRQVLLDRGASAFVFVLNAERLPIVETDRALNLLSRHGVPIGGLIVNRVLPEAAADHPFLRARKEQEARYLAEIDDRFAAYLRLRLPLLPHDVVGQEGLRQVADALEQALEAAA